MSEFNKPRRLRRGQRRLNIYMLFPGWEVRIVKNCDRGLENAARGRTSQPANNIYILPTKLAMLSSRLLCLSLSASITKLILQHSDKFKIK